MVEKFIKLGYKGCSARYQTVRIAAVVNYQCFAAFMTIVCKKRQGSDHSIAASIFIFWPMCCTERLRT